MKITESKASVRDFPVQTQWHTPFSPPETPEALALWELLQSMADSSQETVGAVENLHALTDKRLRATNSQLGKLYSLLNSKVPVVAQPDENAMLTTFLVVLKKTNDVYEALLRVLPSNVLVHEAKQDALNQEADNITASDDDLLSALQRFTQPQKVSLVMPANDVESDLSALQLALNAGFDRVVGALKSRQTPAQNGQATLLDRFLLSASFNAPTQNTKPTASVSPVLDWERAKQNLNAGSVLAQHYATTQSVGDFSWANPTANNYNTNSELAFTQSQPVYAQFDQHRATQNRNSNQWQSPLYSGTALIQNSDYAVYAVPKTQPTQTTPNLAQAQPTLDATVLPSLTPLTQQPNTLPLTQEAVALAYAVQTPNQSAENLLREAAVLAQSPDFGIDLKRSVLAQHYSKTVPVSFESNANPSNANANPSSFVQAKNVPEVSRMANPSDSVVKQHYSEVVTVSFESESASETPAVEVLVNGEAVPSISNTQGNVSVEVDVEKPDLNALVQAFDQSLEHHLSRLTDSLNAALAQHREANQAHSEAQQATNQNQQNEAFAAQHEQNQQDRASRLKDRREARMQAAKEKWLRFREFIRQEKSDYADHRRRWKEWLEQRKAQRDMLKAQQALAAQMQNQQGGLFSSLTDMLTGWLAMRFGGKLAGGAAAGAAGAAGAGAAGAAGAAAGAAGAAAKGALTTTAGAGAAGAAAGASRFAGLAALAKRAPLIGALITGGVGAYALNENANDQTKSEDEKKDAAVKITAETAGSIGGGLAGAMAGQALIPIPILGAAIGYFAGDMIGSAVAGKVADNFNENNRMLREEAAKAEAEKAKADSNKPSQKDGEPETKETDKEKDKTEQAKANTTINVTQNVKAANAPMLASHEQKVADAQAFREKYGLKESSLAWQAQSRDQTSKFGSLDMNAIKSRHAVLYGSKDAEYDNYVKTVLTQAESAKASHAVLKLDAPPQPQLIKAHDTKTLEQQRFDSLQPQLAFATFAPKTDPHTSALTDTLRENRHTQIEAVTQQPHTQAALKALDYGIPKTPSSVQNDWATPLATATALATGATAAYAFDRESTATSELIDPTKPIEKHMRTVASAAKRQASDTIATNQAIELDTKETNEAVLKVNEDFFRKAEGWWEKLLGGLGGMADKAAETAKSVYQDAKAAVSNTASGIMEGAKSGYDTAKSTLQNGGSLKEAITEGAKAAGITASTKMQGGTSIDSYTAKHESNNRYDALNMNDVGGIAYGKIQFNSRSGLPKVIQNYLANGDKSSANYQTIQKYANDIYNNNFSRIANAPDLKKALQGAAQEKAMQNAQDAVAREQYQKPAEAIMAKSGLKSVAAAQILYDTKVQGGLEEVASRTQRKLGGKVGDTVNGKAITEQDYLKTFVEERKSRLLSLAANKKEGSADQRALRNSAGSRMNDMMAIATGEMAKVKFDSRTGGAQEAGGGFATLDNKVLNKGDVAGLTHKTGKDFDAKVINSQWLATPDKSLRMKSEEAYGGGKHHRGLDLAAQMLQNELGDDLIRFSAFNDRYHQAKSPKSKHTSGVALDFTTKSGDAKSGENDARIKSLMQRYGLKEGVDFKSIDEYKRLSAKGTGKHHHLNFQSPEAAEKFYQAVQAERIAKQKKQEATTLTAQAKQTTTAEVGAKQATQAATQNVAKAESAAIQTQKAATSTAQAANQATQAQKTETPTAQTQTAQTPTATPLDAAKEKLASAATAALGAVTGSAKAQANADAKTAEVNAVTNSTPVAKGKIQPAKESQEQTNAALKKADAALNNKPATDTKTDNKTATKTDSKTDNKTATKTDTKTDSKTATKTDSKTKAKATAPDLEQDNTESQDDLDATFDELSALAQPQNVNQPNLQVSLAANQQPTQGQGSQPDYSINRNRVAMAMANARGASPLANTPPVIDSGKLSQRSDLPNLGGGWSETPRATAYSPNRPATTPQLPNLNNGQPPSYQEPQQKNWWQHLNEKAPALLQAVRDGKSLSLDSIKNALKQKDPLAKADAALGATQNTLQRGESVANRALTPFGLNPATGGWNGQTTSQQAAPSFERGQMTFSPQASQRPLQDVLNAPIMRELSRFAKTKDVQVATQAAALGDKIYQTIPDVFGQPAPQNRGHALMGVAQSAAQLAGEGDRFNKLQSITGRADALLSKVGFPRMQNEAAPQQNQSYQMANTMPTIERPSVSPARPANPTMQQPPPFTSNDADTIENAIVKNVPSKTEANPKEFRANSRTNTKTIGIDEFDLTAHAAVETLLLAKL